MSNHTDNLIRELLKAHGHSDLSPAEVREVGQKIAAALIDDVLDDRRKQILAARKLQAEKAEPKKAPITSGARDLAN
jgi:hypothetical protein